MKVVMLGGVAEEKYWHPYPDAEIWGLNGIRPKWVKKFDRMFNIHTRSNLEAEWKKGLEKDIAWANKNPNVPFYVIEPWPEALSTVAFPRSEMNFGRPNYHCGSFDWMVAFAIHLGATEIDLHGIQLNMAGGEPISARACLEFWCGFAEGKGIKVTTARDCDLFWQYHLVRVKNVYGYDDMPLVEDRT